MEETLEAIHAQSPILEPEALPLSNALGRILREPVCADRDQPAFDRSAMDGYAIGLDDDSVSFLVVDRIRAGEHKPRRLNRGEAVQIGTGARLPGNRLQVLMKEDAQVEGDHLRILRRPRERHVRYRGEDAKQGQVLVGSGSRLGPGTMALLASVGCHHPQVTRLPRVLHLATGNEIISCDQTPGDGQIRDSNSILVRAFFAQFGIAPIQTRVREDLAAMNDALRSTSLPMEDVDLLLVSGGASVGEHDFTGAWLESLNYTLHVRRTSTRPGRPFLFGSRDRSLAFGLPGNPLSHFVCLQVYVRTALDCLIYPSQTTLFTEGSLAHDCTDRRSHETLWPSRMDYATGKPSLTLLPWHSSGDLTSLSNTNALARIPPGDAPLSHGSPIPFLSTSPGL